MGGKGGDGGTNDYNAGYSGWSQGAAMHEQGVGNQYYEAGWNAKQGEWDQQQTFMNMLKGMQQSSSSSSRSQAPRDPAWNKGSTFEELQSTMGAMEEGGMWVWDNEMGDGTGRPDPGMWRQLNTDEWADWKNTRDFTYAYDYEGNSASSSLNERADLYGNYLNAGESATGIVNDRITTQAANAALIGVDYSMTDEIKNTMISKEFGKLWGTDEQSRLEELMGRWGNPEGFEDWMFTRLEEDLPPEGGTATSQSSQGGPSGMTLLTEDDENQYALGGA